MTTDFRLLTSVLRSDMSKNDELVARFSEMVENMSRRYIAVWWTKHLLFQVLNEFPGMKLSVCLGEIQWFWHLNFPNVRYFSGLLLTIFYEYGLQWRDWVGQEPKSNSGPTRIRLKTLYNRLWGFVDDSSPPGSRNERKQVWTCLCENIFPIICMLTCKVGTKYINLHVHTNLES